MSTSKLEKAAAISTLTSREFNQDTSRAKKAASKGPVFITDRGKPAHVLLSIADYRRLSGHRRSLVEALSMPGLASVELDTPKLDLSIPAADLS